MLNYDELKNINKAKTRLLELVKTKLTEFITQNIDKNLQITILANKTFYELNTSTIYNAYDENLNKTLLEIRNQLADNNANKPVIDLINDIAQFDFKNKAYQAFINTIPTKRDFVQNIITAYGKNGFKIKPSPNNAYVYIFDLT